MMIGLFDLFEKIHGLFMVLSGLHVKGPDLTKHFGATYPNISDPFISNLSPHGPRDAKELRIELSNQLFVC